jgi:hypothetical protein
MPALAPTRIINKSISFADWRQAKRSKSMDDSSITAALDQADEEILTYTASDAALEAAAGTERGANSSADPSILPTTPTTFTGSILSCC